MGDSVIDFGLFPTAYWAKENPKGVAVVWGRGETSLFPQVPPQINWQQWHQLIEQAVTFLQKNAISSGDLIAYSGSHRLAGVVCYLAALYSQVRILNLNPAIPDRQREAILAANGIHHLLTDQDFANFLPDLTACNQCEYLPSLPATLTLTSGSSGIPKAVVHSIQNHLDNAQGVCELMNFQAQHTWLLSLPLFHVSGQGIVWRCLAVGATLNIVEEKSGFLPALNQVSHASLVPTQLQRYLAYLTQTSSAARSQKVLLGGAYIPPELLNAAQNKQMETYSGYGMTEMASTICASKNSRNSVGLPLKNREVRLEQGEIWVRGAGLGLGYWLAQKIVPFTNAQGWFATKDRGEWLQGELVVKGRLDNLFISGGENVQPEEVEKVLLQSGRIKQAFVVPVSDREFGQRPVAFIEFEQHYSQQAVRSLADFATQYLEKFKLPIAYFALPTHLLSGIKISRYALQTLAAQQLKESNDV